MVEKSRKGSLMHWMHGSNGPRWGSSPGDFDPEALHATLHKVRGLFAPGGYFPTEVTGWDRLPDTPVMLVANHSGGTLIPDVWGLLFAWYSRQGVGRPLHPLAHDMVFSFTGLGKFFARRGVVRAGHHRGYEILHDWRRDLLVYPGGDRETWRPYKDRYQVKFSGRKGYAKLALRAGVPIVPVAHAGAHETFMVLTDGGRLARALRFPQLFRAEVFPVHLSLPWGLTIGPWPHIPVPAKLRFRIGRPIMPSPAGAGRDISREEIDDLDSRVRTVLQEELSQLERESLGQPRPSPEQPEAPKPDDRSSHAARHERPSHAAVG